MYKKLLDKGFVPTYYTNKDWFESRTANSRLFYRYKIYSKDDINAALCVLDKYNDYFPVLQLDELVCYIEVDEDLSDAWFYFCDEDIDAFEIPIESLTKLIDVLPNKFSFEHAD